MITLSDPSNIVLKMIGSLTVNLLESATVTSFVPVVVAETVVVIGVAVVPIVIVSSSTTVVT